MFWNIHLLLGVLSTGTGGLRLKFRLSATKGDKANKLSRGVVDYT